MSPAIAAHWPWLARRPSHARPAAEAGSPAFLRYIVPTPKATFLDFEQPIGELESKIDELRFVQDDSAIDGAEAGETVAAAADSER